MIESPERSGAAAWTTSSDIGHDAPMSVRRREAWALADGSDWTRVDDFGVLDALDAAGGLRRADTEPRPTLQPLRLVAPAPVAAPPPAPAAAPAPRAAAPAAAPAEPAGFPEGVDVAAQVAVLQQAAREGVPFCEVCEREAQAA